MNTKKEWKILLKQANEELAKHGVSIDVNDNDEEGYFKCEIFVDGKHFETYAENFYEDELDNLVNDVYHYALNKFGKSK